MIGAACAIATGLMTVLMYPGAAIWPLALVAYVPLLWWLEERKPGVRAAFLGGLVAGAILHAGGHYWIAFTMQKMSGMPAPVSWLILLGYGLLIGLHQAIWAALVARTRHEQDPDRPLRRALFVASMYAAVEFLIPFQFPWFLGNAVYRSPLWLQAADLVGIWGVSLLCLLVSALLVAAWRTRGRSRNVALACLGAVFVLWLGYGALRLSMVEGAAAERTVRIAVVQPNPSLREKTSLKPRPRIPMQDRAEKLTRAMALKDVDAVVWPEGSLPFYYVPQEAPPHLPLQNNKTRAPRIVRTTTDRIHRFNKELGKPLLFGSLRRVDTTWTKRARNSAILLQDGKPVRVYDKRKLVAFGEYMPGRDLIPALNEAIPGVSDLEIGAEPSILPLAGARAAISICYEALFPSFMHEHARDAELMINLTDDIWFGPTNAPELHVMVQAPRTVELRRPLLRATATGISTHIDATGAIHFRTPVWKQDTRVAAIKVAPLDSPFRHVGLWPMRALCLFVVVSLVMRLRGRREPDTAPQTA